jgi:hypothetical protein
VENYNAKQKDQDKHELLMAWQTGRFARTDYKLPEYATLFPKKVVADPSLSPIDRGKRLRDGLMMFFPPKLPLLPPEGNA